MLPEATQKQGLASRFGPQKSTRSWPILNSLFQTLFRKRSGSTVRDPEPKKPTGVKIEVKKAVQKPKTPKKRAPIKKVPTATKTKPPGQRLPKNPLPKWAQPKSTVPKWAQPPQNGQGTSFFQPTNAGPKPGPSQSSARPQPTQVRPQPQPQAKFHVPQPMNPPYDAALTESDKDTFLQLTETGQKLLVTPNKENIDKILRLLSRAEKMLKGKSCRFLTMCLEKAKKWKSDNCPDESPTQITNGQGQTSGHNFNLDDPVEALIHKIVSGERIPSQKRAGEAISSEKMFLGRV